VEKKNNLLADGIDALKIAWRHRKGNEIPATILDTIDILYPPDKPRILPIRKGIKKTPTGWHMIFTLRPGTNFSTLKNQQEYFEDACRLPIVIEKIGGYAHFHIYSQKLEKCYPFEWHHSQYPKMYLPFPVGISQSGLEVLDLVKAPHFLISGTTNYGKSTLIYNIIHALLPIAKIAIVDLKRLQYSYLKKYVALAKNENDTLTLLQAINKEMGRRIDLLEDAEVEKIQNYKGDLPFIVLIIDEIAEVQDKETIYYIDRLARLARAVGISIVAATQRPSKKLKVFEENTRDMFAARVCYLMPDEVSSRLVLGETCSLAAKIPEIPGRGIYKYGVTIKTIQTMFLDLDGSKELLKKQLKEVEGLAGWANVSQKTRLLPR